MKHNIQVFLMPSTTIIQIWTPSMRIISTHPHSHQSLPFTTFSPHFHHLSTMCQFYFSLSLSSLVENSIQPNLVKWAFGSLIGRQMILHIGELWASLVNLVNFGLFEEQLVNSPTLQFNQSINRIQGLGGS